MHLGAPKWHHQAHSARFLAASARRCDRRLHPCKTHVSWSGRTLMDMGPECNQALKPSPTWRASGVLSRRPGSQMAPGRCLLREFLSALWEQGGRRHMTSTASARKQRGRLHIASTACRTLQAAMMHGTMGAALHPGVHGMGCCAEVQTCDGRCGGCSGSKDMTEKDPGRATRGSSLRLRNEPRRQGRGPGGGARPAGELLGRQEQLPLCSAGAGKQLQPTQRGRHTQACDCAGSRASHQRSVTLLAARTTFAELWLPVSALKNGCMR